MSAVSRALSITALLIALISTLILAGCRHTTPAPLLIAETLTGIAAAPQIASDTNTSKPSATPTITPTITPTLTPTPQPTATSTPPPTPLPPPPGDYYPTQASYRLDVNLDYQAHSLQTEEHLIFTNTLGLSLTDLLLNVPPNGYNANFKLSSLLVNNRPTTYELQGTSLRVALPEMVLPGDSTALKLTFSMTAPFMRGDSIFGGGSVGYSENAFNAGNWYPILAPYHAEQGWQETPWHTVGDPYVTDMGDYVVTIHTLPEVTVVGPGTLENWPSEGRWRFTISAARSFAFAASHRYESTAETAYGLTIASYYYPEHKISGQLALANAAAAARLFGELFGPYPYPNLRIAETDFSGGQEFSGFMIFGSATHQSHLDAGGGPRTIFFTLVTHETAHQWWYGIVGNDQAREPWLDEAFAKYSEQIFYERLYPEQANWRWASMGNLERQPDLLNVTIYDYTNRAAYKNRVYLTGALFLAQLRQALGDDDFFALIQEHYRRGANRIVTTGEFLSLLSKYGDPAVIQPILNSYFNP